MIVADDNAGAVANDGGTKYFSGTQYGTVDGSLVATDIFYHLVLGVEDQNTHLLMIQVSHLHHKEASILSSDGETQNVSLSDQLSSYSTPSNSQISLSLRDRSI